MSDTSRKDKEVTVLPDSSRHSLLLSFNEGSLTILQFLHHIIPSLSFLAFLAGEVIAINLIVQVLYFKRTASYDLLDM